MLSLCFYALHLRPRRIMILSADDLAGSYTDIVSRSAVQTGYCLCFIFVSLYKQGLFILYKLLIGGNLDLVSCDL